MALSPWEKHRMSLSAQQSTQLGGHVSRNTKGYHMMLLRLATDKKELKHFQSRERKEAYKRKILANYQPWVDGALSGGSGVQDDVLMTILLWKIDAGDYEGALDIAVYALANRLVIPGVNRTTGTVIAEEIADSAMRAYAVKSPVSLATLERTRALTDDEDMPDEVRAKLYKILGLVLRDNNRPQESYCVLSRALELNINVGIKTELKQLDKVLKAQRDAEKVL